MYRKDYLSALAIVTAAVFSIEPTNAAPLYDPENTFTEICAACHSESPAPRAMPRSAMNKLPPERILKALSNGVMSFFALPLTADERGALAAHISTVPWIEKDGSANRELLAGCKNEQALNSDAWDKPRWSGWGVDLENTRFQRAAHAGLSEPDLKNLEIKWAFGFAGSSTIGSQPAVVGGRIFIGSPEHRLYSLDAQTGCAYWRFDTEGGVRGAPVVINDKHGPTVIATDRAGWVFALDANSGALRWKHRADEHPATMATASPVFHDGRVYVTAASFEENSASASNYPCCTFRGSVTALDATSGKIFWKTYVIPEEPQATGTSPHGAPKFGPAGAGIWNPATVDVKRGRLYVTTGDAYSRPASINSDAVVALELDSGTIAWSWQGTADDAYTNACLNADVHPEVLAECGPDVDFGASAILRTLRNGSEVLLAGQKSGVLHALNPDDGTLLWQKRLSPGGILGGIEWGIAADDDNVYVPISDVWENLDAKGAAGGIVAIDFNTGKVRWEQPAAIPDCIATDGCVAGQPQAATVIPGLIFSGSMDAHMRVYRTSDGVVVWDYDANREYETVNGVKGHGGSFNGGGAIVVDGMVYVTSGYGIFGIEGNVLLAFGKRDLLSGTDNAK